MPDDDTEGEAPLGRIFSGYGVHTDIVVAAAEAYVAATNALLRARHGTAVPIVTPADAGVQTDAWIPASAGMPTGVA